MFRPGAVTPQQEFGSRHPVPLPSLALVPALPPLPDGLTPRPLSPDDVDAVAGLLQAAEKVDDTGENFEAEDLTEWWVNELVDLGRDGLAVCAEDGSIVAFGTAIA